MKNILLTLVISMSLLLSACGGDDEADSNEPAQSSFTSKPNNKQLLAMLKDSNRYDIQLEKGSGWNTTHQLRKRWHKNYNYKVKADIKEYPDATALIYGEFRFQINSTNYDLDIMRTVLTEFYGIPLPSEKSMQDLLSDNYSEVLRKSDIIDKISGPNVTENDDDRNVIWHSGKSFSINVDLSYSAKNGNNLETKQCRIYTRFYRENNTAIFDSLHGGVPKCKVIDSKPYVAPEIVDNSAKEFASAEKLAQAAFDNLVDLEIPQFQNGKEAIRFVYQTLHTGNKATIHALMANMFSSQFFVENSKVQLNQRGQEVFDKTMNKVFAKGVNFQNSYCPQLLSRMTANNYVILVDALNKNNFSISVEHIGGKMNRGKMQGGKYKITELSLAIMSNQRDIENLKSWPIDELCEKTAKHLEIY